MFKNLPNLINTSISVIVILSLLIFLPLKCLSINTNSIASLFDIYIKNNVLTIWVIAAILSFHFVLSYSHTKEKVSLKNQTKKFNILFDHLSEGVAFIEFVENRHEVVGLNIVNTNNVLSSMLNQDLSQIKELIFNGISLDDRLHYFKTLSSVVIESKPITVESIFGGKIFKIKIVPWKKDGIVAIFYDITEQRLSFDKIKKSEEKFAKLFYNNPANIFIVDVEKLVYVDVNQTFEELNHNTRDFFIGKSVFEYFTYKSREEVLHELAKIQEGGSLRNVLIEGQTIAGEARYNLVSVEKITIEDTPCLLVATVVLDDYYKALNEIKDRELKLSVSENYFKTLIDNAPVGILSIREGGGISYVSQKIKAIFKLPADYKSETESVFNWVKPEDVSFLRRRLYQLITLQEQPNLIEIEFINGEGNYFWGEVQSAIIKDNDDQVKGVFVFIKDISQRKNDEFKIKETLSLLNSAFESSSNAILIVNKDKIIAGYNQKYLDMCGIKEVISNRNDFDLLQQVLGLIKHPEEYLQKSDSIYQQEDTSSFDLVEFNDGRIIERYSEPRYVDGQVVGRVWRFLDVTVQRAMETERSIIENTLIFLAKKGWIATNEEFLKSIVIKITNTLGVDFAFVIELSKDKLTASTLAISENGTIISNFEYLIDNLLYNDLITQKKIVVTTGAQQLYPSDIIINKYNVEGYLAIPLWSSRNEVIGLMVVMSTQEISNVDLIENIISLLSIRVSAEIERNASELQLMRREELFQSVFRNSQNGIFLMKNDIIVDCNAATAKLFKLNREDIVGNTPYHLSPVYQPDGKESKAMAIKIINDALEGEPQNFQWTHADSKGKIFFADIKLNRILIDDKYLVLSIIHDVSERYKFEKQLLKSESRLRKYAHHLQDVREEERMFISRELHDNIGQLLTALRIDMFRLAKKTSAIEVPGLEAIHKDTMQVISYVDDVIQSIRKISREVRPTILDDLGLFTAIENQAKDFQIRTNIICKFVSNVETIQIKKSHEIGVYRIIQESLTNIARHAKATNITISVKKRQNFYHISVADDGIGIKKTQIKTSKSLGLLSMNERAALFGGKIIIKGSPGIGTVISIQIPVS